MSIKSTWLHFITRLSVRGKLGLLTALIALGVITLSVIAARMQYLDLYNTRMHTIQQSVQLGNSVLSHYAELERAGTLTRDQAQSQAIGALAAMRAGDGNFNIFFTMLDLDNRMVMHPFRRERAGMDLADFNDGHGRKHYVEMVEIARKGGGFVEYMSTIPGRDDEVVRISYAETFEPLGMGQHHRHLSGRRTETGPGLHCNHDRHRWCDGAGGPVPLLADRQPHHPAAAAGHPRGAFDCRRPA